jgi:hypothetical protein
MTAVDKQIYKEHFLTMSAAAAAAAVPVASLLFDYLVQMRDAALAAELGLDQPEVQQPVRNYRCGFKYCYRCCYNVTLHIKAWNQP